jgi:RNA polymerase sigma-70 factor (ECF subfamily)
VSERIVPDALVHAARAGERAALDRLIAREAPRVRRFASKLCSDAVEAEDVAQDALVAAAVGLPQLRDEGALTSWLYTLVRSACMRRSRREPRGLHTSLEDREEAATSDETPDDALARQRLGRAIEQAIETLDPAWREVVLLRDVEGLAASEVAELLGLEVEAVKSRLHRARVALRARLLPVVAPAEPTVPSDPACPDIVSILSRHLEGDVDPEACAAMEAHVTTCTSCSRACESLRETIASCRVLGVRPLDPHAREALRATFARVTSPRS